MGRAYREVIYCTTTSRLLEESAPLALVGGRVGGGSFVVATIMKERVLASLELCIRIVAVC